MTAPLPRPQSRLSGLRDAGLWAGAAAVVAGLHVAAALWAMRQPAAAAADTGPPPAIMIDMAPMPTVTESGETQIAPDMVDSVANAAPDTLDPPDEVPPEETPPEPEVQPPPADVPEPVAEPPEKTPEPEDVVEPEELPPPEVVRESEVALPVPVSPRPPERPKPPEKVVEKQEPPKKRQPPPSAAAARARADAPVADRTAAPQDSAARAGSMSPAQWQSRLFSHLNRRKPKAVGSKGIAAVNFSIDAAGNVLSVRLARSSGSSAIDNAAVATVQRSSPVPAPPPGASRNITVPIEFK